MRKSFSKCEKESFPIVIKMSFSVVRKSFFSRAKEFFYCLNWSLATREKRCDTKSFAGVHKGFQLRKSVSVVKRSFISVMK